MKFKLVNNFSQKLDSSLGGDEQVDTTIKLDSGADVFSDATENVMYPLTIFDVDSNGAPTGPLEVVYVTGYDSSTGELTVQRGQEGTEVRSWPLYAGVELRLTQGVLESITESWADTGANEGAVLKDANGDLATYILPPEMVRGTKLGLVAEPDVQERLDEVSGGKARRVRFNPAKNTAVLTTNSRYTGDSEKAIEVSTNDYALTGVEFVSPKEGYNSFDFVFTADGSKAFSSEMYGGAIVVYDTTDGSALASFTYDDAFSDYNNVEPSAIVVSESLGYAIVAGGYETDTENGPARLVDLPTLGLSAPTFDLQGATYTDVDGTPSEYELSFSYASDMAVVESLNKVVISYYRAAYDRSVAVFDYDTIDGTWTLNLDLRDAILAAGKEDHLHVDYVSPTGGALKVFDDRYAWVASFGNSNPVGTGPIYRVVDLQNSTVEYPPETTPTYGGFGNIKRTVAFLPGDKALLIGQGGNSNGGTVAIVDMRTHAYKEIGDVQSVLGVVDGNVLSADYDDANDKLWVTTSSEGVHVYDIFGSDDEFQIVSERRRLKTVVKTAYSANKTAGEALNAANAAQTTADSKNQTVFPLGTLDGSTQGNSINYTVPSGKKLFVDRLDALALSPAENVWKNVSNPFDIPFFDVESKWTLEVGSNVVFPRGGGDSPVVRDSETWDEDSEKTSALASLGSSGSSSGDYSSAVSKMAAVEGSSMLDGGTLRVFDTSVSDWPEVTLSTGTTDASLVKFSPDGSLLVVARPDASTSEASLRVYSTSDWSVAKDSVLLNSASTVYALEFSDDGTKLFVGHDDTDSSSFQAFNTSDWTEDTSAPSITASTVECLAFGSVSGTDALFVSLSGDPTVYDTSDWSEISTTNLPAYDYKYALFNADASRLYLLGHSDSVDPEISTVDTSTWEKINTTSDVSYDGTMSTGHLALIKGESQLLAVAFSCRLMDVESDDTLTFLTDIIGDAAGADTENREVYATDTEFSVPADGVISIYDSSTLKVKETIPGTVAEGWVALSSDGKYAAYSESVEDPARAPLAVYDREGGTHVSLSLGTDGVDVVSPETLKFSPDGTLLALGGIVNSGFEKQFMVINTNSWAVEKVVQASNVVMSVAFSSDSGRVYFAVNNSKGLHAYDTSDWSEIQSEGLDTNQYTESLSAGSGRLVAGGFGGQELIVLDEDTLEVLYENDSLSNTPTCVDMSSDGRYVVACLVNSNGKIYIVDVDKGELIERDTLHLNSTVGTAAFTNNDLRIVLEAGDGVRDVDVEERRPTEHPKLGILASSSEAPPVLAATELVISEVGARGVIDVMHDHPVAALNVYVDAAAKGFQADLVVRGYLIDSN